MKSIKYICGWCGKPCEEDGTPWALEDIPKAFKPSEEYININGDCCRHENEKRYIQVTHDMASDWCCPEMEGDIIEW